MPSPFAHFLAGLSVHVATAPAADLGWRRRTVITVAAAIAPDLDLVLKQFGLAVHQGASHGIGAALLAGAAVAAVAALLRWPRPLALGLAAFLGWSSHIVLDLLNLDTHPPIGADGPLALHRRLLQGALADLHGHRTYTRLDDGAA